MKSSSHKLHPHSATFCIPGSTSLASATLSYCQIPTKTLKILPEVHDQVQVTLRLTVSQSVSLGVEPRLGLMNRLSLFDIYGLVFVGRPL
jgi:hypothetical protein